MEEQAWMMPWTEDSSENANFDFAMSDGYYMPQELSEGTDYVFGRGENGVEAERAHGGQVVQLNLEQSVGEAGPIIFPDFSEMSEMEQYLFAQGYEEMMQYHFQNEVFPRGYGYRGPRGQKGGWNASGDSLERRWYNRPKQVVNPDEPPPKATKAGRELRALLDFYFEPFNLQHNKYLLDLVIGKLGNAPPANKARWSINHLAELRMTFEDLKGLNRIANWLEQLYHSWSEIVVSDVPGGQAFVVQRRRRSKAVGVALALKNLRLIPSKDLVLATLLEIRGFMPAPNAEEPDMRAMVEMLMAAPEKRPKAPEDKLSIATLNCSSIPEMRLSESAAQNLEGKIRRQLLLYHADVICIQGINPFGPVGKGVVSSLMEIDGFDYIFKRGKGEEVFVILWDRLRLELEGQVEFDGGLSADMKLRQDEADAYTRLIRVINYKAEVPPPRDVDGLKQLLETQERAILFSVDCLGLGGAEMTHVVEELSSLRSTYRDVLDEEPACVASVWDPDAQRQNAVQRGASNTLKLCYPDTILYRGLVPHLVLAGHSPLYLSTLTPEEAAAQIPAFRLPLMAMYQWPEEV